MKNFGTSSTINSRKCECVYMSLELLIYVHVRNMNLQKFFRTTFEPKQDPKFDIAFLLETNLAKVKQKQYRSN